MVTFDPDEETKAQTETKIQEEAEKLKLLQELKGKKTLLWTDVRLIFMQTLEALAILVM